MFISVFEPPFLPIQLIYVQGIIELFYLFIFKILKERQVNLNVLDHSGMGKYYVFIVLLWIGLSISRIIDVIFFNGEPSPSNWIKSTNQFLVLTFIEFINIGIILNCFQKYKYSLNDIFESIINIGALQGLLSVLAFEIYPLRMLFLKFAGDIYNNSWILERRGYGFSQSLLDGFGYGMGLIAGILVLKFNFKSGKSVFFQVIKLILIVFSILVNSRTGLIILFVALLLRIAISDDLRITLIKIPVTIILFYILIYSLVPLVNIGMSSMNTNINWIASDIGGLIKALIPSVNINVTAAQAHATSNPYYNLITNAQFPNNTFQFLFGKGWQVYEGSQLGYRSDNGYINMLWMLGIVGTTIYYFYNLYITVKLFNKINKDYYLILIFNYFALLIYSIKGRPVGFSSGIIIFYLVIFSITYFNKNAFSRKGKN